MQTLVELEQIETIKPMNLMEFIEACTDFNKINPGINISDMESCPVHVFSTISHREYHRIIPGIAYCPLCEKAMCSHCGSHNVEQLSRVTGYIQAVSGWNEAKVQELRDRKRYNI